MKMNCKYEDRNCKAYSQDTKKCYGDVDEKCPYWEIGITGAAGGAIASGAIAGEVDVSKENFEGNIEFTSTSITEFEFNKVEKVKKTIYRHFFQ
jgi:hypothetical protein